MPKHRLTAARKLQIAQWQMAGINARKIRSTAFISTSGKRIPITKGSIWQQTIRRQNVARYRQSKKGPLPRNKYQNRAYIAAKKWESRYA